MKARRDYDCCCECHGEKPHKHPRPVCDCGKPVTPPKTECPPPPPVCQPGEVYVPQDEPFPSPPTTPTLPGSDTKPPAGDPGEIPWFRGQINTILRKGPSFGPRKDEFLPYLLVRATSNDRGGRPANGVFWESPDIFIAPNLEADVAPLNPPTTAGVAEANKPNTLYAHVWNLGKAPAYRVRVEFYWFNPSLGFSQTNANLIGATWVDLGNRFTLYDAWQEVSSPYSSYLSRGCHAIVRCPVTWVPTFENNGHECLIVRAFEPVLDAINMASFDSKNDRHVGQRNIAVVQAASPATIDLGLDLGYADQTGEIILDFDPVPTNSLEWLKLYTGSHTPGFTQNSAAVTAGFLPPTPVGTRLPQIAGLPFENRMTLLRRSERITRGCDPLKVAFHASIQDLQPKQAQVLRLRQRAGDEIIGGYTIVLLRK